MMDVLVLAAKIQYRQAKKELDNNKIKAVNMGIALVGAGIGDGFANTNEPQTCHAKPRQSSMRRGE